MRALRGAARAARAPERALSTRMEVSGQEGTASHSPAPTLMTYALTPPAVVEQLDRYIVGQRDAKRAVAVALRNRWRRHQLPEETKAEITPKNILMIGPTGCGKTEIARRIAKLSQAPFIKVEATKFTEVGFHGRDVDQIIRDLLDVSIQMTKKRVREQRKEQVEQIVEERILDILLGSEVDPNARVTFRNMLHNGALDSRMLDVEVPVPTPTLAHGEPIPQTVLKDMVQNVKTGRRVDKRKLILTEARALMEEQELEKIVESYDITKEAIASVETAGIVFLDEIDKLISTGDYRGADASSEGVQRDLLPLIEGCVTTTKHGNVSSEHILFICSGAFHSAKPSDMLAELQGRLPIRVNLQGLTEEDLYRILTEPVHNLVVQQRALLGTEGVVIEFTECGKREIARVAHEVNTTQENIGARRLSTVMERVVEEVSFEASEMEPNSVIEVDAEFVRGRVSALMRSSDLSRYVL